MNDQNIPFEVTRARRAGARLAAVQALYEMEQTGKSARATIRAFMEDRLGIGPNEEPIEEADPDIFKSIVNAVVDHQAAHLPRHPRLLRHPAQREGCKLISRAAAAAGSARR